jgi:hypothetical protein
MNPPQHQRSRWLVKSPVAVEKRRLARCSEWLRYRRKEEFVARDFDLSGRGDRRPWHLAEESHQALDILRSRRQEELFTNKLHPAQAQATESDLILKFCKQRFHLSSLPHSVISASKPRDDWGRWPRTSTNWVRTRRSRPLDYLLEESDAEGAVLSRYCVNRRSIKGDVKNIFLPPPDAQVYFATSSPSHQRRRWSGVVPWVAPSQQRHLS